MAEPATLATIASLGLGAFGLLRGRKSEKASRALSHDLSSLSAYEKMATRSLSSTQSHPSYALREHGITPEFERAP